MASGLYGYLKTFHFQIYNVIFKKNIRNIGEVKYNSIMIIIYKLILQHKLLIVTIKTLFILLAKFPNPFSPPRLEITIRDHSTGMTGQLL